MYSLILNTSSEKVPWTTLLRRWSIHHATHYPAPFVVRSCRECTREDIALHSLARFRRAHQLPGANWCISHGISLHEDKVCSDLLLGGVWFQLRPRIGPSPGRRTPPSLGGTCECWSGWGLRGAWDIGTLSPKRSIKSWSRRAPKPSRGACTLSTFTVLMPVRLPTGSKQIFSQVTRLGGATLRVRIETMHHSWPQGRLSSRARTTTLEDSWGELSRRSTRRRKAFVDGSKGATVRCRR